MREIKFRAWNKEVSQFFTWDLTLGFQGTDKVWGPVEQFTGLHDKNGVEIYEGDVIAIQSGGRSIVSLQVVWHREMFTTKHLDEGMKRVRYRSEQCDKNGFDYDGMPANLRGERVPWVVIGNIHQNPELLNG